MAQASRGPRAGGRSNEAVRRRNAAPQREPGRRATTPPRSTPREFRLRGCVWRTIACPSSGNERGILLLTERFPLRNRNGAGSGKRVKSRPPRAATTPSQAPIAPTTWVSRGMANRLVLSFFNRAELGINAVALGSRRLYEVAAAELSADGDTACE